VPKLRGISICALAVVAVCVSTAVPAGASSVPTSPKAKAAAAAAVRELGVRFEWGGATPKTGFDDSGLVVWAFTQAGVRGLPHFAGALWIRGARIAKTQLQPGDLVFFNQAAHVGIYVGHGTYVDAPHTGRPVRVARLAAQRDYTGAVRIR
jgi:cell wall-associated NlpC family hydrolase